MSVELYDSALLTKIQGVYENTVLSPPERAFQACAELKKNNGKVRLPLLSLYRFRYTLSLPMLSTRGIRRGRNISYTEDKSEIILQKTIPLDIEYQLDVWTDNTKTVDNIVRELLFWFLENPDITVTNPNGMDFQFSLIFDHDVENNSDVMSFEQLGRLYRMTVPMRLDNAVLFSMGSVKTVFDNPVYIEIDE